MNHNGPELSIHIYWEGFNLKKIILGAVALVIIMGISAAWNFPPLASDYTNPNTIIERNLTFSFEQSVQGTGYFMTYKYAKMGNIEFKDYSHGSGTLDSEAILSAFSENKSYHMPYDDWNDFAQNCIQYKDTSKMTYAPMQIAIGTAKAARRERIFHLSTTTSRSLRFAC